MRKFIVISTLLGASVFGLTQFLDGVEGSMTAGTEPTGTAASLPPDWTGPPAPTEPIQPATAPAARAAPPPTQGPARPASSPAPTQATPAPTPAISQPPATTTTTTTTTTAPQSGPRPQQPGPAHCTVTLSNTTPSDGETVTAVITSNRPGTNWYAGVSHDGARKQAGRTDGDGGASFAFPVRAGDDGEVWVNVDLRIGSNIEPAKCMARYTVS